MKFDLEHRAYLISRPLGTKDIYSKTYIVLESILRIQQIEILKVHARDTFLKSHDKQGVARISVITCVQSTSWYQTTCKLVYEHLIWMDGELGYTHNAYKVKSSLEWTTDKFLVASL